MPHIKKSLFFPEKPSGNELPYLISVEQLKSANLIAVCSALFGFFQGLNPLIMLLVVRCVFRQAVYLYWKNDPDWKTFSDYETEKERIRLREGATARKTWLELAYLQITGTTNVQISMRGDRLIYTARPELICVVGIFNGLEVEEHVFPIRNVRIVARNLERGRIRFPYARYTGTGDLTGLSQATIEIPMGSELNF